MSGNGESRADETSREIREETSVRKVAFASATGTTIEWYDFFLRRMAAALVFKLVFKQPFFYGGQPEGGDARGVRDVCGGVCGEPGQARGQGPCLGRGRERPAGRGGLE